jgi:ubiquinone/menaquinone biosynthesis C-methylase UbiE
LEKSEHEGEEPDQYFLGQGSAEHQRLRQQAQELEGESSWLFDQIGISPGSRVVEIGCGPQGCLELLATRVGPQGSVVGVEVSEESVDLARRFLADRVLTNVEVVRGDAKASGLAGESFDLATARLVLVNVPEPEKIVAEMVALVRPGGTVALHEADYVSHVCDPPLPAWDRLMLALKTYSEANLIDLFIGRRIPRMLRAAGLQHIRTNPLIHVYGPGHSRRPIFLQFVQNLRDRIIATRLLSEGEFADNIAALEAHLDEPTTFVISHLFVQAWGQKP